MLWIKAFHIIFMVTWFSGLFYLPRLFVYHAMATDSISIERFKLMERKLYYGIMAPGSVLTILFGLLLIHFNPQFYMKAPWFHIKLSLVLLLIVYHLYLGKLRKIFKQNQNRHSHLFYRILNEVPVLFLAGIIILVIVQPFSPH
jgi:putative membrane protein